MQVLLKNLRPVWVAARIWITTSFVLGLSVLLYGIFFQTDMDLWWMGIPVGIGAAVGSLPVLLVMAIALPRVERLPVSRNHKINKLLITAAVCTLPYALVGAVIVTYNMPADSTMAAYLLYVIVIAGALFACSIIAMLLNGQAIKNFFSSSQSATYSFNQINQHMETEHSAYPLPDEKAPSNKTVIKAVITGVLILVMMIPTLFVTNLVTERQQRQEEVVKEVSSKWASDQTIAGPYIYLPYTINETRTDNKVVAVTKHLLLLPENMSVTGSILPEIRPRSIYKVLLYKSNLSNNGNFNIRLPKEIPAASLQLADAKICFGITDFKGIEEKVTVTFNGVSYELSPGLPVNDLDANGLSAPVNLQQSDFDRNISYGMQLKIKGSEQLHFVPLSGNSSVQVTSTWSNPSFDGNNLPGERRVDKDGFAAKWTINKANLPFGTVLRGEELQRTTNIKTAFDKNAFAFGVSMLQPADQYAKTMRSVKYAILFIGLTFSLFFIVEVMQKKPLHPVQYVLVGLALVIFYTLLLAVSEFLLFDQAYYIAAAATILLITMYAKSHFQSWKTAMLFGGVLTGLYGFIFILIRLEDTALLVGSIGLFLVLALVMYGSRNINWYHTAERKNLASL